MSRLRYKEIQALGSPEEQEAAWNEWMADPAGQAYAAKQQPPAQAQTVLTDTEQQELQARLDGAAASLSA
jgi:hypothetical protein